MWIQLIAGTGERNWVWSGIWLWMKYIPVAAFGGFICWAVYLMGVTCSRRDFLAKLYYRSCGHHTFFRTWCKSFTYSGYSTQEGSAVVPLDSRKYFILYHECIVQNDWMEAKCAMAVVTIQYALELPLE